MKNGGIFIYNNDNDMLFNNKELFDKYKSLNFGIENKSDIMARNIVTNTQGSIFDINIENRESDIKVEVPISGKHFVYNSLCAIAVGLALDINMCDIISGIKEFSLTKNRMEVKNLKDDIIVINDSYNASYDSMKAALEYLGGFNDKYKIAVLGDMLELGKFSDELHFNVGKCVYENKIDLLITVGSNSKKIADGACSKGMLKENVYSVDNNEETIKLLNEVIVSNSAILLKASNSMNFNEIYNNILKKLS